MKLWKPKFLKTKKEREQEMSKKKSTSQDCCASNTVAVEEKGVDLSQLYSYKKTVRLAKQEAENTKKIIEELEHNLTTSAKETKHITTASFTLVEICLSTTKGLIFGEGVSRKSEDDEFKADRGYKIARGRAEKSLLNRLHKFPSKQKDVFVG